MLKFHVRENLSKPSVKRRKTINEMGGNIPGENFLGGNLPGGFSKNHFLLIFQKIINKYKTFNKKIYTLNS